MKKIPLPGRFLPVLLLCAGALTARAQTRTLSGTVTTEGRPLAGVSVSQEDRSTTAVTNSQGYWQLTTEGDHPVLLFRHPDYAEERTEAGTQTTLNTQLTRRVRVSEIEEVVVNAGYYKVKDRERTGSIARVTAKDIENQPVTNVLSAVQGRMAGVSITQSSGVPGGGFDVQIRGRNSLRTLTNGNSDGNQPLYIVDDIPWTQPLISTYSTGILPLRNINPLSTLHANSIESIEILKDADATAIYGSRGANGVVLITTKKGKKGGLRLALNNSYSLSKVASRMKMMNTDSYLLMRREAYDNAGIAIPTNAYDVNGTWDPHRYTDWQKVLIGKTAEGFQTQATISGGNAQHSFLSSATHANQETVFPGAFNYKTTHLNSSYQYRTPDRKFELDLTQLTSLLSSNYANNDLTTRSLSLSPNAPSLYDNQGNINWENNTFANPVAALAGSYNNTTKQFNQSFRTSYSLSDVLKFQVNGGINYQDMEEFSLSPHTMYNPAFPAGSSSANSSSSRGTSSSFSYVLEPQVHWQRNFNDHRLNAIAGFTFQHSESKYSAMSGSGFASNALIRNIAAASLVTLQGFNDHQYRYAALFGRLNYQFKNKYLLNITARRDGSSRFGPSNRFANFGAVGAAWILSDELFFSQIPFLSFAKLRASYGITGSDLIGDDQYTSTYTSTPNNYNNVPALFPSRLYNPNFSWEKTRKAEIALELGLFNNRINTITAYYNNKSSQQLIGIPLSAVTGFPSVLANLDAEVENRGLEIEVLGHIIKKPLWDWRIGFNFSLPRNELISFPGLEGSTYANSYVVGEPTTIVKVLEYEGIDPKTGTYVFKDFNQDGKISTPDDAQTIRNIGIQYLGGFHQEFRYDRLSVSLLLQFVKQNQWNYYRTMSTPGTMNNQPEVFLNVWSPANPNGIIMPFSPGTIAQTNTLTSHLKNSTAAISDASFIRLKNIQISYQLPLKNTIVKEAEIYLQGQNIWTWTSYFGLDPEFIISGFLPPLKTYSMGFKLTF